METLAGKIARDEGLRDVDGVGWIIRLAKTIEPIHSLGVAHGNLAAEAIEVEGTSPASRGVLADIRRLTDVAAYHSPERTIGEDISAEDDTWATAVTLYFVLTRSLPFPGADDREVRRRIFGSSPAPLAAFDVGDEPLQRILDRAFSRAPLERITSLHELREALEKWHPDAGVKDLPPLDHVGSLLLALSRRTSQVPVQVPKAPVPAIYGPDDEEDGPTKVRDVSTLQAHLAVLTGQPIAPVQPAAPVQTAPAAPPVQAAPAVPKAQPPPAAQRTPAAQPVQAAPAVPKAQPPSPVISPPPAPVVSQMAPVEEAPVSAPVLPFDRDSAPGPIAAPILPLDRDSASDRVTAPALPFDRDSAPDRVTAPIIPFDRESAPERPAPAPTASAKPAAAAAKAAPKAAPATPAKAATPATPVKAATPATPVKAAPAKPATPATPATPAKAATPAAPREAVAKEPPAPAKRAAPKTISGTQRGLLAALVVLVTGGLITFLLLHSPDPSASGVPHASASTAPAASHTAQAPVTAPSASTSAAPSAPASAEPAASQSATPSASASAEPAALPSASASAEPAASSSAAASDFSGAAACMMPLFGEGTFVDPPAALEQLCTLTDPRRGVEIVKTQVVVGGAHRVVSDGMREWAIMGWYGMPAIMLLRTACCPAAAEAHIPFTVPACDIETALKGLTTAATSKTATDADVDAALDAYTKAAKCTARAGSFVAFDQKGGIQEGELVTFKKTLARVRAAVKAK